MSQWLGVKLWDGTESTRRDELAAPSLGRPVKFGDSYGDREIAASIGGAVALLLMLGLLAGYLAMRSQKRKASEQQMQTNPTLTPSAHAIQPRPARLR